MAESVEVKTSELVGPALDWAVAKAIWDGDINSEFNQLFLKTFRPSTDWGQGGPLLDSMVIGVIHNSRIRPYPFDKGYQAMAGHFIGPSEGPTILIATCRAIVAAKLGDVVQVPKELDVEE